MAELTRKEIRRHIGYDVQGVFNGGMVVRQATAFTETTLTDPALIGAEGEWRGDWLVINGEIV